MTHLPLTSFLLQDSIQSSENWDLLSKNSTLFYKKRVTLYNIVSLFMRGALRKKSFERLLFLSSFNKKSTKVSRCTLLGNYGQMERALPEARLLWLHRDHLRVDQVRGEMEHRAHQRQEHPSYVLRLVPRREDGAYMLPGQSPTCGKLVVRSHGVTLSSSFFTEFMNICIKSPFSSSLHIPLNIKSFRSYAVLTFCDCSSQFINSFCNINHNLSTRIPFPNPHDSKTPHPVTLTNPGPHSQDGFVLVGSVAGQRYWSTMLPADVTVTCGAWTPDDTQVYVATAQGGLIVMDLHGNIVSKVTISPDTAITDLQWNCEKFNMEEREEAGGDRAGVEPKAVTRMCVLAICSKNGDIRLVTSYDDLSPVVSQYCPILHFPDLSDEEWCLIWLRITISPVSATAHRIPDDAGGVVQLWWLSTIYTSLNIYDEWCSGEFLAVAGRVSMSEPAPGSSHLNRVSFYSEQGASLATFRIPYFKVCKLIEQRKEMYEAWFVLQSAVTALTWGHNDKRLFVATGTQARTISLSSVTDTIIQLLQVHIGWISKKIPSLQLLCRLKIHKTLGDSTEVDCLPLPCRLKSLISSLFTHSIKVISTSECNIKPLIWALKNWQKGHRNLWCVKK